MPLSPTQADRAVLLNVLVNRFNGGELKRLAFLLGINENLIGGDSVAEQALSLLTLCERQERLDELAAQVRAERPTLLWWQGTVWDERIPQVVQRLDAEIAALEQRNDPAEAEALAALRARQQALAARLTMDGGEPSEPSRSPAGGQTFIFHGNVEGSTFMQGDQNIRGKDVQTGGIRTGDIKGGKVTVGQDIQGSPASDLLALARNLQQGAITVGDIEGKNVVVGLRYTADSTRPTQAELAKEVAALRDDLAQAIAAGTFSDEAAAEDAQEAVTKASTELAKATPNADRVTRSLTIASDIIIRTSETAEAAGKLSDTLARLAPFATALAALARTLFGGF